MDEIIINAADLTFCYPGETTSALNGFSATIKKGSFTAFLGPNGSGKSTFFSALIGLIKPLQGSIRFQGETLSYKRTALHELHKNIGLVLQDPDNQLFSASVLEEISFGPFNLGLPPETVKARTEAVMDELNITPFAHKPAHALSGGQKKRVTIADILVMEPQVILFDEPFSSLDSENAATVRSIISDLHRKGITILISTHDVDYALAYADEVIVMKDGQNILSGPAREILASKTALESAGLARPKVLDIFDALCQKGVLSAAETPPRDFSELERYLLIGHLN